MHPTVDGRNPAPADMVNTSLFILFTGFYNIPGVCHQRG